jgi:hypothetical protein
MIEPFDAEFDDAESDGGAKRGAGPAPRRIRRDVVIGAAALAGAALIAKGLSNGSEAPSASPSLSPSPTAGRTVQPEKPVALPPPRPHFPAACPESLRCLTQEAGNGSALEPVRSRLPKAELVRFQTVLLETHPWTGRLWYREMAYRLPHGQGLEVVIRARTRSAGSEPAPANAAVVFVGGYVITVAAPRATGLNVEELLSIAGDERLLTT